MLRRLVGDIIKIMLIVTVLAATVLTAPFFSFSKKSYESICADAAAFYGIEESEYTVRIHKGKVTFAAEMINGSYNLEYEGDRKVYVIDIETNISRPMNIETIFHEFAHAAQTKYNMDFMGYNREQHAEIMAFNALWKGKYWYNALHVLSMHTFKLKPDEYLAPSPLWKTALTGVKTSNF